MPVAASVRRAAAASTPHFDWLLPADRPHLTIAEISRLTHLGATFLEEHFEERCHRYNGGKGKRWAMRIPRAFVLELLVSSARYTAEEKRDAVAGLAREFTPAECRQIAAAYEAEARRQEKRSA